MTTLGTRVVALAGSAMLHVGVALSVVGHAASSVSIARGPEALEVPAPLVETIVEPSPNASAPIEARSSGVSRPTHTHPYPVPPGHDLVPHDPSIVHVLPSPDVARTVATETEVLAAPEPAPAHFVMTVRGTAAAALWGSTAPEGVAEPEDTAGTTDEDGADARPVLLAGNAPPYPAAAAAAGVEVDVPVAIVIGVDGTVVEARSRGHFGYGLDEAAVQAVRGYRFSRGLRGGRPARVRMTWTVMFRLK